MLKPEEKITRHRDLNWLSFNERVLQEAQDNSTPLYERLKFLAIFSMNLDEYFRVRVSQLRQMKRVEKSIRKKLALKPNKTVKQILKQVKEQQDRFGKIYREEIIPELETAGIYLVHREDYDEHQEEFAHRYFKKIKKCIETKIVGFPDGSDLFLENNALYYIVSFSDKSQFGIVNVPTDECGRFITFSSETTKHKITFLDDIVKVNIPQLFPEKEIEGIYQIKLSRDAELYIDDEIDGLLAEKIYDSLKQRTDAVSYTHLTLPTIYSV